MGKALITSRTLWANVLAIAAAVAGVVPQQYGLPGLAIVNILLRLVTSEPITGVVTPASPPSGV